MRRFLLGFVVALALAIPVTLIAAPPKTVNVVTPMKQDLDANGYGIFHSGDINGRAGQAVEMNSVGDLGLFSAAGNSVSIGPYGSGDASAHFGGGDVTIQPGRTGYLRLSRLPTSDPHSPGVVWIDVDTLKVSSG